MSAPLVSCRGVGRRYGSGAAETIALFQVDCDVDACARIAITGASGSGKSTLVHLMAGLDRPSSGSVSWPGLGPPDSLRPSKLIVVFQGPSLLTPLTVLENVALPLLLAGHAEREAQRRAAAALAALDLDGLAESLPDEISGGQAQRAAIARALAVEPRLILADEPTSQLDQASAEHVIDVLLDAADATGAAVVIATHDIAVARRFEERWSIADGVLGVMNADRGT
jgi:ABC-type lipoprotein export system ATPase subunit